MGSQQLTSKYNSYRYGIEMDLKLCDYFDVNIAATARIIAGLSVEAGINNIFDRNYVIAEGFPEVGRNYFLNLHYTLFK